MPANLLVDENTYLLIYQFPYMQVIMHRLGILDYALSKVVDRSHMAHHLERNFMTRAKAMSALPQIMGKSGQVVGI